MSLHACAPPGADGRVVLDRAAARVLADLLLPGLKLAQAAGRTLAPHEVAALGSVLALAKHGATVAPVVAEVPDPRLTCKHKPCAQRFPRRTHGPVADYCSPRCRLAAFRARRAAEPVSEAA